MASYDSTTPQWVEIKGIIEVRTDSYDPGAVFDPLDMFDLQRDPACMEGIPDDYCCRDYHTGEQNYFYCIVCKCEIRSMVSLEAHVMGKKHVSKSMEKKRISLGLDAPSVNMPKYKELKKKTILTKADLQVKLRDRLLETAEPVLGLEYVKELISKYAKDHPLYNCTLEGCSSAWGTSDDMFHHVKNQKHQKNFLKKRFPDDIRITALNNAEILTRAIEFEEHEGGADARDYRKILKVKNQAEYNDIKNRPNDWSEKKAKLGVAVGNANKTAVGPRRRYNEAASSSAHGEDFSPEAMFPKYKIDGREKSPSVRAGRLMSCMEILLDSAESRLDELENGSGEKDKAEHDNIARRVTDLRAMSGNLEMKCLHECVPKYNAFKKSLKQMEARLGL